MAKPNRPLTQREIRAQQEKKKKRERQFVTLYNKSKKKPVYIQLRAPEGMDFYTGEQTVTLHANEQEKFPVGRLYSHQVINHEKQGRISILSGREHMKNHY